MGNWNTIPKHKLLKKSTLISVIRKNKNSPKEVVVVVVVVVVVERERERENSQFLCGKQNMDWMKEMISNLYKIKWEEK